MVTAIALLTGLPTDDLAGDRLSCSISCSRHSMLQAGTKYGSHIRQCHVQCDKQKHQVAAAINVISGVPLAMFFMCKVFVIARSAIKGLSRYLNASVSHPKRPPVEPCCTVELGNHQSLQTETGKYHGNNRQLVTTDLARASLNTGPQPVFLVHSNNNWSF